MSFFVWKTRITNHLPSRGQLTAVYGVIVLMVYGWTIYWYFWKLPSWLYFMTLGELLVTYLYAAVVNFIESLLILLVPVLIGLLLPIQWFKERFVAKSVTLVILLLVALMNYLNIITALQDFPPGLLWMILVVVGAIAFSVFLIGRVNILHKVLEEIAYRAAIFIYIFLPISAISILVIFIRNVLRL